MSDVADIEVMVVRVSSGDRRVWLTRTETEEAGVTRDVWVLSSAGAEIGTFDDAQYSDAVTLAAKYLDAAIQADTFRAQADALEQAAMSSVAAAAVPPVQP